MQVICDNISGRRRRMMQYHFPARCCSSIDIGSQSILASRLSTPIHKGDIFEHLMHGQIRLD
ncbi:MAG: hypothetical protein CM1200mP41_12590 [Gammaproteobacteria bacterium]|nr:MAG: hypothetical protein CM1200mP41_12590 [Gammaproteobacteria bacterium]